MNLTTSVAGHEFASCMMNASGMFCGDEAQIRMTDESKAGTVVTKTATLEERQGNPSPSVAMFEYGSINSMGLPNKGIHYYLEVMEKLEAENPNKTYFLSVTEFDENAIVEIMRIVEDSHFGGMIELNLSCPNVIGKPLVGYDFDQVDHYLERIFDFFTKPLGVKLPPYFDGVHFDKITEILSRYPLKFINTINSVGNGLMIEDETVAIKPKNGFGGIGGGAVKQTALANVHALYTRLGDKMDIIGTGGVEHGRDIFEHILCGAKMVQVGTTLGVEKPQVFDRLSQELEAIMAEKGYASIEDFRGKLKYQD
jgi:dihydroorotate dehydrogenase (fumarate)